MALTLLIDPTTHGELSETERQHYIENDDGTYRLDTVGAGGLAVENVGQLKRTLETERGQRIALQQQAKKFEGIEDPQKALEALQRLEEFANFDPDTEVAKRIEARETQLLARHKDALGKQAEESKSLRSQLEKVLVEAEAIKALQEAGGNTVLLLPHIRQFVRMDKSPTGMQVAQVVGHDGNPRVGDAQGNPMTIAELIAEMKSQEAFASAFTGNGQTGSGGAAGDRKVATARRPTHTRTVSITDQDALDANIEDIAAGKIEVVE